MNSDDTLPSFDRVLADARLHRPFSEGGGPSDFGFETRLRAALAPNLPVPGFAECFASLSLRFSAIFLPPVLAVFAFLALNHRHSLPEGLGGLVAHWAGLLPFGI